MKGAGRGGWAAIFSRQCPYTTRKSRALGNTTPQEIMAVRYRCALNYVPNTYWLALMAVAYTLPWPVCVERWLYTSVNIGGVRER